jgi:hypothetical protein
MPQKFIPNFGHYQLRNDWSIFKTRGNDKQRLVHFFGEWFFLVQRLAGNLRSTVARNNMRPLLIIALLAATASQTFASHSQRSKLQPTRGRILNSFLVSTMIRLTTA